MKKKYSFDCMNVSSFTRPPNAVMIASENSRYTAVSARLTMMHSSVALPTLLWASSLRPAPRLMETNAQQPSPIITASASATTVSGKTTVLAALPHEPRYDALAMKI